VNVEPVRHGRDLLTQLLAQSTIDGTGLAAARVVVVLVVGLQARPASVQPVGLVGLVVVGRIEVFFQMRLRNSAFIFS
jgi:hypothetical protein